MFSLRADSLTNGSTISEKEKYGSQVARRRNLWHFVECRLNYHARRVVHKMVITHKMPAYRWQHRRNNTLAQTGRNETAVGGREGKWIREKLTQTYPDSEIISQRTLKNSQINPNIYVMTVRQRIPSDYCLRIIVVVCYDMTRARARAHTEHCKLQIKSSFAKYTEFMLRNV